MFSLPVFRKKSLTTSSGNTFALIDGGFCANNPALYALCDATGPISFPKGDCRLLSIGVGHYPEPKHGWGIGGIKARLAKKIMLVQLLQKTLDANTESMDVLRKLIFKDVPSVRVSESYTTPDMATDMFESNLGKLNLLRQRGRESYGLYERDIESLFDTRGSTA